jgi:hypothetical protein
MEFMGLHFGARCDGWLPLILVRYIGIVSLN